MQHVRGKVPAARRRRTTRKEHFLSFTSRLFTRGCTLPQILAHNTLPTKGLSELLKGGFSRNSSQFFQADFVAIVMIRLQKRRHSLKTVSFNVQTLFSALNLHHFLPIKRSAF